MKTRLLIIIAILIVLFPLIPLVQYHIGNQVMADSMTVSGSIVLLTSFVFSMISWFLLAWASKSIKVVGIPLSIISSAILMIPFYDILGPMAAVIIGVVAGFVAFMFHKHMITRDNKSLIITIATVAVSYLALTIMIILVSNTLHIVDTGYGIGSWTGTVDGMETRLEIGGGSIDLDPDLSPSYALDFAGGLFYLTFLPLLAIFGIISSLFLVPYFILKRKNIPSRPYMALILSGILLHYGITSLIPFGNEVPKLLYMLDKEPSFFIQLIFPQFLISIIVLIIAGILLYKSSVIRGLLKR